MNKLYLVGISHRTAPVEWREKLAVPEEQLPEMLERIRGAGVFSETVVLSTCNRVEAYAVGEEGADTDSLRRELTRLHGDKDLAAGLYVHAGDEAVHHLFRVAAGLDSLVIGESEILGQVKKAYDAAKRTKTTGKQTNVLFQRALFVGKKVRSETKISEGPTSTAGLAVALAQRIFGSLHESRVLVVGAGAMAEQALRSLVSQKVAALAVANRTEEKARVLAERFGGSAVPFARLTEELSTADIVLCSTGAPEPIFRAPQVAEALSRRRNKSLFFIDIAVPRDVDPAVHRLDNVYLYNIDDLESLVAESLVKRHAEIERAGRMADEKAREFSAWQRGETPSMKHAPAASRRAPASKEAART